MLRPGLLCVMCLTIMPMWHFVQPAAAYQARIPVQMLKRQLMNDAVCQAVRMLDVHAGFLAWGSTDSLDL